jgi:hypothetical protein
VLDASSTAAFETFLVERCWPDIDLSICCPAAIGRGGRAMTAEGTRVEHVGSILMPADHVVFSLIAAADESVVRQLNERANLPADRIAEAIALLGPSLANAGPSNASPKEGRTR